MHPRLRIPVLLSLLLTSACSASSSSTSPSTPASPQVNVTGTWIGDLSAQGGQAQMRWMLTQQADSSVSGPVLVTLANGIVLLNGFFTGKINGAVLPYTISVGPGSIPAAPACSGQIGGTMTVTTASTSTMAGSFAVTSSTCTSPFANGNLTMTKR